LLKGSLTRLVQNCNSDSLYSRPGCHVVSKAFSMSKNTAAVDILLLKFREAWSVSLIHWSVMLWRARKPNWLAFSKFVSSMCLWIILRINFSKKLPVVDRRLIGRKFCGNFGFLPGFGLAIILTSFQGAGKWQSQRQWLNKCVMWTRDLLGKCLRYSFGLPSIPQALPTFRDRKYLPSCHLATADVYRDTVQQRVYTPQFFYLKTELVSASEARGYFSQKRNPAKSSVHVNLKDSPISIYCLKCLDISLWHFHFQSGYDAHLYNGHPREYYYESYPKCDCQVAWDEHNANLLTLSYVI
jgi:hypothetical protein